jgi:hypothetical protein
VALAVDGVIEISQERALAGSINGDSVQDPPGFPVRITQPGSYRLTGNLTVTDPNQDGIVVQADDLVSIDCNGFGLFGPGSGGGVGIGGDTVVIRNGAVRAFGADGINISAGRVERMLVASNGQRGIAIDPGDALVLANMVWSNGDSGLVLNANTAYSNNHVLDNGAAAVVGGRPLGGNVCDDGTCTTTLRTPLRRYYLTNTTVRGDGALTACTSGFHMASLWEISEPSTLQYETAFAFTAPDSGSGPPTLDGLGIRARGWVRTGYKSDSGVNVPGIDNCDVWTTGTNGVALSGTTVRLSFDWRDPAGGGDPVSGISPWVAERWDCGIQLRVWCIED